MVLFYYTVKTRGKKYNVYVVPEFYTARIGCFVQNPTMWSKNGLLFSTGTHQTKNYLDFIIVTKEDEGIYECIGLARNGSVIKDGTELIVAGRSDKS